ncbi:MAG: hypothetical protein AB9869_02045 [Verrucomicrobiia bacterium]
MRGLNLGVDGFDRWSFINRGDLDGHWEMIATWDDQCQSLRKEFTPKPNSYFVYGLISRLNAKNSEVLSCERTGGQIEGTNRVFAAALRSPNGGLTWVIVNDAPRAWQTHVAAPERALYKYQVTAAERDQPTLRIDASAKLHLTAGEFDTTLPPLSLTIFSTFQRAHRRPGIITD